MVAKTIRVLAASALVVTSLPALAGKYWDDHDDRGHPYRHEHVVVVHEYPARAIVVERPVYVERTVVVERRVYVERPIVLESPVPAYEVYGPPVYEPASVRAPSGITRRVVAASVGAVAGAAIGSSIGRGNGRTAAIAVGAVLGGILGSHY
jgi:hypothetical protein